jgi:hypothetical protein
VKRNERLFVIYYLGKAKGNATEAAKLAGFGSNRNSSGWHGHQLLKKPKIREAIDAKLDQIAMSQEEVLVRLSERAASSAEDFVTVRDKDDPHALPYLDLRKARRRGQLGNVKKLKTTRSPGNDPQEVTEVEVHDALPALALLMKFYGLGESPPPPDDAANPVGEILGRIRKKADGP